MAPAVFGSCDEPPFTTDGSACEAGGHDSVAPLILADMEFDHDRLSLFERLTLRRTQPNSA